jgi:hypothetical protein
MSATRFNEGGVAEYKSYRQLAREASRAARMRREQRATERAAVTAARLQASEDRRASQYLPTVEEIAASAAEIQAGWTPAEKRYRYLLARTVGNVRALDEAMAWTFPEIRCVDFCDG